MGCLDHPHFSVMINGASKDFFPSSRGIRQGNPLSPLLFTLVVDAFSALMAQATSTSIIKGFNIGRNRVKISHLQFADDTICFIRDEEQQISHLKLILQIFEKISGLKVNFLKSWLVGIGVDNG